MWATLTEGEEEEDESGGDSCGMTWIQELQKCVFVRVCGIYFSAGRPVCVSHTDLLSAVNARAYKHNNAFKRFLLFSKRRTGEHFQRHTFKYEGRGLHRQEGRGCKAQQGERAAVER